MPALPKKYLIVQTAFIGDVILATPLAEALHRLGPCEVHFMAIPAARNLLENNPHVQKVLIYDKRGKHRGLRGMAQQVRLLRRDRYHAAFVPHRSLRSALLVALARIPNRIGFNNSAGAFLFTRKVNYLRKHEVDRNLDLLRPLGNKPRGLKPKVVWDAGDALHVHQMTKAVPADRSWIAFASGSVWATKRWPAERYGELAHRLIRDFGVSVFLIGGEMDRELCNRIQAMAGEGCINTAGMLTLRQSAALLDRCEVLVSNDSAPVHLAVATRCKVIAIFGPTAPDFGFAPFGEGHEIVERKLACRPCSIHGSHRCPIGTHACMMEIQVGEVLERVEKLLVIIRETVA